jgi:hypothetical protein
VVRDEERLMPGHDAIRRLIGCDVDVARLDGRLDHGRLLNANRRSLWLVDGDEDRFIALTDIEDLHLAS